MRLYNINLKCTVIDNIIQQRAIIFILHHTNPIRMVFKTFIFCSAATRVYFPQETVCLLFRFHGPLTTNACQKSLTLYRHTS